MNDLVTVVHSNGVGEGVIWRVIKSDRLYLRIAPVYTATGSSVLRPKRVTWHSVERMTLGQLSEARRILDQLFIRQFHVESVGELPKDQGIERTDGSETRPS